MLSEVNAETLGSGAEASADFQSDLGRLYEEAVISTNNGAPPTLLELRRAERAREALLREQGAAAYRRALAQQGEW